MCYKQFSTPRKAFPYKIAYNELLKLKHKQISKNITVSIPKRNSINN